MNRVYLMGVVGVFRKCRDCGQMFRVRNVGRHYCNKCWSPSQGKPRAYTLTDKAKAFLAAERTAA